MAGTDAISDHTTQHMLVLTTLFCMLLIQLDLMVAYMYSVQRMAMSHAVMHIFSFVFKNYAGFAVHAAKETVKLLQKALYT